MNQRRNFPSVAHFLFYFLFCSCFVITQLKGAKISDFGQNLENSERMNDEINPTFQQKDLKLDEKRASSLEDLDLDGHSKRDPSYCSGNSPVTLINATGSITSHDRRNSLFYKESSMKKKLELYQLKLMDECFRNMFLVHSTTH